MHVSGLWVQVCIHESGHGECVCVMSPGMLALQGNRKLYSFAGSWGVNTPTVANFECFDVLEHVVGKGCVC